MIHGQGQHNPRPGNQDREHHDQGVHAVDGFVEDGPGRRCDGKGHHTLGSYYRLIKPAAGGADGIEGVKHKQREGRQDYQGQGHQPGRLFNPVQNLRIGRLAMKGQDEHAKHVESGETSHKEGDERQQPVPLKGTEGQGTGQNFVFAQESGG